MPLNCLNETKPRIVLQQAQQHESTIAPLDGLAEFLNCRVNGSFPINNVTCQVVFGHKKTRE